MRALSYYSDVSGAHSCIGDMLHTEHPPRNPPSPHTHPRPPTPTPPHTHTHLTLPQHTHTHPTLHPTFLLPLDDRTVCSDGEPLVPHASDSVARETGESAAAAAEITQFEKNCDGCWRRRARAGQSCDDCQQTSQSQARPPGTAVLRWPRPIVSILRVIASESDTNLQRRGILKTSFFFLFLLFSFQQERAVSVKIGSPGLPAPGSHLHFYHRVRQIDNRGGGGVVCSWRREK